MYMKKKRIFQVFGYFFFHLIYMYDNKVWTPPISEYITRKGCIGEKMFLRPFHCPIDVIIKNVNKNRSKRI